MASARMNDERRVVLAVNALDAANQGKPMNERVELDDGTARTIAALWRSGGIGESFVSTGAIPADSSELWRELFADDYRTMHPADKMAADYLGTYLTAHAGRGPVEGWYRVWATEPK